MRRPPTFIRRVHPCARAAALFALSLATSAGIGLESDGGGFFIYCLPVSGNAALSAWIATAAVMAGAPVFVATYVSISIARSYREWQLPPRGFAVVVAPPARPAASAAPDHKPAAPAVQRLPRSTDSPSRPPPPRDQPPP
jgi:hypothetical protein